MRSEHLPRGKAYEGGLMIQYRIVKTSDGAGIHGVWAYNAAAALKRERWRR